LTKKIHVHLVDDLDASEASETLIFELDGSTYEIDLSSRNAQKFRAEIAPYIQHARTVASNAGRRRRAGTGPVRPRGRAWAASRSRVVLGGGQAAGAADYRIGVPGYAGGAGRAAELDGDLLAGRPPGPDSGDEEHITS
jgi:Lsr2